MSKLNKSSKPAAKLQAAPTPTTKSPSQAVKAQPNTPAPAAKVVAPAPVAAKVPVVKVAAARNCPPGTKLTWLVKVNPKRAGSASHGRASLYWGSVDVGTYLANGGQRVDLAWDADHGFVALAP